MTTAIDTNVIIALWQRDPIVRASARVALDSALAKGALIVAAPVFAELLAAGRTEAFLGSFLEDTGILVDWLLDENVWRLAGNAFAAYAARRRRQGDAGPRRILADFLIGAHAVRLGCPLLTMDRGLYRAAFPQLVLLPV